MSENLKMKNPKSSVVIVKKESGKTILRLDDFKKLKEASRLKASTDVIKTNHKNKNSTPKKGKLVKSPDKKTILEEQRRAAIANRVNNINTIKKKLGKDAPKIFNLESPKPLAIGIYEQIRAAYPRFSAAMIRRTLSQWVNKKTYKAVLIPGSKRYNLDGSENGIVTFKQVMHLHEKPEKN